MVHEISLYPHWMNQACGRGAPRRNSRGMPEASLDPDLALALFVGPTLLDASLDIEDLSATRLYNAELTLSESFKFPRADQRGVDLNKRFACHYLVLFAASLIKR
jgi:hypothetical protein